MLASTKGRYALRMMIDIARQSPHGLVPLREIGERQGISSKYLEQLARPLCAAGLLTGTRGQHGGYVLGRDAREISAGDILRAAEGTVAPVACLVSDEVVCARASCCETNEFWTGLEEVINHYVDGISLERLVEMQPTDTVVPGACVSLGDLKAVRAAGFPSSVAVPAGKAPSAAADKKAQ